MGSEYLTLEFFIKMSVAIIGAITLMAGLGFWLAWSAQLTAEEKDETPPHLCVDTEYSTSINANSNLFKWPSSNIETEDSKHSSKRVNKILNIDTKFRNQEYELVPLDVPFR